MNGKFIVFEGIDGCGKGTQLKMAVSYFFDQDKNTDIYMTREPTRDFKEIRQRMAEQTEAKKDARWYAETFVKDRKNHINKYILPALNNGTHVFCDRYKHSTLAYQHTQGMEINELIKMHEGLLIPDLTIIFDCPALTAFERRKHAGAEDMFDKDLEFQEELRQNYLKLKEVLKEEKIIYLDATKKPQEIFERVKDEIKKIMR